MTELMDFQLLVTEQKPESVLLLHHWDTDGLACAALFEQYLSSASPSTRVVLMHPTINLYFLTEAEYKRIATGAYAAIVMMDFNAPLEVVERLEQLTPAFFVFDHHAQTAEIHRPGVQDPSYPGASQLVADYLMQPLSVLSVAGMVGDQEDKIREWDRFYPMVEQVLKDADLSFDELQQITKRCDTMYMIGDDDGLDSVVELLKRDPREALHDQRLTDAEKQLSEQLEAELEQEMESLDCGTNVKVWFQELTATANLISEVTRARAKTFPEAVILTAQLIGSGYANIYIRTRREDVDLRPIADWARAQGFNAGGKKEVTGIIVLQEQLEECVDGCIGEIARLLPS